MIIETYMSLFYVHSRCSSSAATTAFAVATAGASTVKYNRHSTVGAVGLSGRCDMETNIAVPREVANCRYYTWI